ncbi:MAG: class I SAM-dependent methyltransferase [Ignavibacteria bacterium]|jgi:ubiquinone/menaquinone biosynthesis C-methylase UbiE
MNKTYEKESYKSHEKHIDEIEDRLVRLEKQNSIDYWRHNRMYSLILPLLKDKHRWLTVGDGIGTDANWLIKKGMDVTASDISDTILKKAQEKNYISKYSKENAENINFKDNAFDYVLCKEAYHHFPRPYIAVYEMLRVSKKAIVLIEPIDIGIEMPILVFFKNVLDKISPKLINKIWKNRFSFETVGNYVYKTSEREIEKIAMGINLPYIAFKGINDYHSTSLDLSLPPNNNKVFKKVRTKIRRRNFLCHIGLIPYQLLVSIIFKEEPSMKIIQSLKDGGYKLIKLKRNPYI